MLIQTFKWFLEPLLNEPTNSSRLTANKLIQLAKAAEKNRQASLEAFAAKCLNKFESDLIDAANECGGSIHMVRKVDDFPEVKNFLNVTTVFQGITIHINRSSSPLDYEITFKWSVPHPLTSNYREKKL